MAILSYLISRLKEPSTYAGLASLFGLIGLKLAPEAWTAIVTVLTAIAGAVAVFVPDLNKPSA